MPGCAISSREVLLATGLARERAGDLPGALRAYEEARRACAWTGCPEAEAALQQRFGRVLSFFLLAR